MNSQLFGAAAASRPSAQSRRLRFDRSEWSGAFGDLGTDLPLLVGMILAAGLDAASVLTVFGLMQIATALRYRMPMPVQPLKAMAAIVIATKLPGNLLYGGGLAIGLSMLVLSATGWIDWISRAVPKPVVRGIQCGLGLQLAGIALRDYVHADGATGLWLAGAGFTLAVFLIGRRRVPAAVILVLLGVAYAFAFKLDAGAMAGAAGIHLPKWHQPTFADIWSGFLVLALPQIPLSIANSVLATRQLAEDLFPERGITARKIGWTYSIMNLLNPFLGGVPTCHGSGGMAGHYAFGGRTGGSVVIYGGVFIVLGVVFGPGFDTVVQVFPLPILGVLLLFEAITLLALLRDLAMQAAGLTLAILVGLIASSLPYGYLIGLIIGILCFHLSRRGLTRLGAGK
ncbi:MAG: putative sulfate/molybdate transporter [Bryobacteraceae bacterium]